MGSEGRERGKQHPGGLPGRPPHWLHEKKFKYIKQIRPPYNKFKILQYFQNVIALPSFSLKNLHFLAERSGQLGYGDTVTLRYEILVCSQNIP